VDARRMTTSSPHADGTEEWMTFFKDNEGRMLALMEQAKPAV
jgi:hypothetical protein